MNYRKVVNDIPSRKNIAAIFALSLSSMIPSHAQIAAWDFFGESSPSSSSADIYNTNLDSSSSMTRGAGAAASNASNSFRTTGFQNNGIATTNTDFFQITLSSDPGQFMSLTTIDARFAGTATFAASPGGVSSQFAYSLDGTTFNLIGSPVVTTGTPATLPQISLAGIPALQNVPAGTTVTLRYYASGQTTTGGWGFNSPAAGQYGLAIGGSFSTEGGSPLDTTAPMFTVLSPTDNATGASITADLAVTFDESVQAGTGNITIKKTSDNSDVEVIPVTDSKVTITGNTVTINPATTLDFDTEYYVLIDSGAIKDIATTPNNFAGISDTTVWSFTTRSAPIPNSVFITQYYEGTSNNKFIELFNNGTTEIDLSAYSLTLWSNANAEAWKNGGSASLTYALTGTLPAGAHLLLSHGSAAIPSYAVPGDVVTTGLLSFNGNDSVVLFQNTEIVDAVSFTAGNEGQDKSFYRLNFDQGYNTTVGSSILDFPLVWGVKTNAEVDSATSSDAWYLQRKSTPPALTLSISPESAIEDDVAMASVGTVTRSGSTVGELEVEIAFDDPTEVAAPFSVVIPDGQASATFDIATLEDELPDGNVIVTFTVRAPGFVSGTATFTVIDDGDVLPSAPIGLKINEIRTDDDEADGFEYFELYNTTNAPLSLKNVAYLVVGDGAPGNYGLVENVTLLPDVTIPANGFYLVAKAETLPIDRDTDEDASVDFTATPNLVQSGLNFENSDNLTHILVYGYTGNASSDIDSNDDGTVNTSLPWVTLLDAVSQVKTIETVGVAPAVNNEYYYGSQLGGADIGPDGAFPPAHIYRSIDGAGTWTIGLFGTDLSTLDPPLADNSVLAGVKDTPGISNVVSASNFSTWASANGATNDPLADHDNDGVKNGVEYFMGQTGSTFTTMPSVVDGAVTWPKDPTANASYVVKTSVNLIDWSPASGVVDNGTSVTFTLPTGQNKIFVRLEVTIP